MIMLSNIVMWVAWEKYVERGLDQGFMLSTYIILKELVLNKIGFFILWFRYL